MVDDWENSSGLLVVVVVEDGLLKVDSPARDS